MLSCLKSTKITFQIFLLFLLINCIFCQINYGKDLNDTCSVNLQCLTGCCQEEKCVETDKCTEFRNQVYMGVAIVGIALAVIFTMYLFKSLRQIKDEFYKKAQEKRGTDALGGRQ